MSALSRPLASISSDPLEGLKVTAANRFKNILLGSFDPSSLPYAFLKSQIDDQAVRATAAGAFNRKWEIATPTQRSFTRAASYEDELAQRIAELASYKFNPTPPRGGEGGGSGKTAVNLGENLGGSGSLSGGGLTPQTAQSVKAALNPQTQTPQAAQTAQEIKQALNAQTPQPQPTLSPNLQKPNLINTIEAQPALKTPSVKMNAKTANEIDNVPLTSQKEFNEFVDQVLSKDYQNAPNIQRVAVLNPVLKEALGVSGDKVFILKRHLSHFRPERKAKYNQALRSEEIKQLPSVINNATTAYKDEKGFFIAFEDSLNAEKLNFIHFKADENGNFIITVKKVNANELSKHKSARVGVEPTTPKAENQPLPFTENKASLTDAANSSKNLAQSQVAETNIQKEAVRPLDAKIAKNNAEIRAVREQMAAKYPEETRELLKEEGITEIRGLIDSRLYNKILRTHPKDKLAQRFAELDKENERLGLLKANADSFTRKYKEELAKDIIELFRKEIGVKNDKESAVEYWVKKGFAPSTAEKEASKSLKLIADSRVEIEAYLDIRPIAEFGTNYAEFYRDGTGAVKKLMAQKQGQVAGAFYREELGDITLAWGEAGTGKSDGWGLAKIVKYHPEVLDNLSELVEKSPIVKESDNRYLLDTPTHFLAIRKEFDGQKENWLLTAFEKDESIARRRTDLPSSQSEVEKAASTNTHSNSSKISQLSQAVELKTAIKEALKGPKKAPAVKHEGLKELEAVLKERLKEASGDVSFQRAQAREWRQTLESAQEAQKSSERLDHLKFRLAERIGDFRHAQRVRTDYEAKLRELGGVESSFKELSKKLSKLSKNPKPQDLSELYATKEGLLRVEGLLRGVEVRGNAAFNKLRSEVTQALEKSFDAINAAKKGLTPKAVEAAAPTRTQEFLDFTQDAKARVEWALGVSADAAEKTIDELVKKSGGESAKLKFLERLRASVKALGQESSEVVTPKTTEAVTPNLQKANLIKERLKNYKKD